MKCNADICCLYFISSNPGILQRPNLGKPSRDHVFVWSRRIRQCPHSLHESKTLKHGHYRGRTSSPLLLVSETEEGAGSGDDDRRMRCMNGMAAPTTCPANASCRTSSPPSSCSSCWHALPRPGRSQPEHGQHPVPALEDFSIWMWNCGCPLCAPSVCVNANKSERTQITG
jgi:hypothetical protein